jgi:membrane fusion protein (multidrug efflux system)
LRTLDEAAADARNAKRRKMMLIVLGVVVAKAGLGWGAYEYFHARRFVSTEDAYTSVEAAQVTPAIAGIVREVRVTDTQAVKRGDVLVTLDDIDARLALAQAEADRTRAAAQLAAAKADFDKARLDLSRRDALLASGSVSADEVTKARNAFEVATAQLGNAEAGLKLASARQEQAQVNLDRTVIHASVDGVVAKRTVQAGQQVQAGSPLLTVVPVADVHVDANFKEVQLERVRVGQPVTLKSDYYGGSTTYHGTVEGLSGGTGSAFATIPAQNATGNWIKVVQRVPVRIALKSDELAQRPLQVGLSMTATIDTGTARQ